MTRKDETIARMTAEGVPRRRHADETIKGLEYYKRLAEALETENLGLREKDIYNKERIKKLEKQAVTDPLTSLKGKAGLKSEFNKLAKDAFGVILVIDLNNFKPVNDKYGHAAGDKVLKEFAKILRKTFRRGDIIARDGGDEFVVVMKAAEIKEAQDKIKDIQKALDTLEVPYGRGKSKVIITGIGASIGISSFSFAKKTETLEAIKNQADKNMYEDKKKSKTPQCKR